MTRFKSVAVCVAIFCITLIESNSIPKYNEKIPIAVHTIRYKDELSVDYHMEAGKHFVKEQTDKTNNINVNKAKNMILFLGDGMSVPTLAASRVYMGGEKKSLSFEQFPYVAMSKT